MKIFRTLILLLIVISCINCEKESLNEELNSNEILEKNTTSGIDEPIRSENELIIKYTSSATEEMKIGLRKRYQVSSFERCSCTNDIIEKWKFDIISDIEGRKGQISQEGGVVESVEFEFNYGSDDMFTGFISGEEKNEDEYISQFLKEENAALTIAVLDTGVNLSEIVSEERFLYREEQDACTENEIIELYGWDYVNKDNDTFDELGHGTMITQLLILNLENKDIDYNILPVKIFDEDGRGSYFDLLCGYLYATSKESVSLINMSFGWYKERYEILHSLIEKQKNILHITSAGNRGNNNDRESHFPSSYKLDNIISIGSINEKKEISKFSNFGKISVDFLSLGEDIEFNTRTGNNYIFSGTSFAVPTVTAKSLVINRELELPLQEIINTLYIEGYDLPHRTQVKYRKYIE